MAERIEGFQVDDNVVDKVTDELKGQFMEVKILMYGKGKVGKTCLGKALATGSSSRGAYVQGEGPKSVSTRKYGRVTVYDTRQLLPGKKDAIEAEIKSKCHPKEMDSIIICQAWNAAFDEENLEILHHLDPDAWGKVVFALTRCDELPLEIQLMSREKKVTEIKRIKQDWKKQIQATLRCLNVHETIVETIRVVFTTHTDIENNGVFNWTLYGETSDYNDGVSGVKGCITKKLLKQALKIVIGEGSFIIQETIDQLFQDARIKEEIDQIFPQQNRHS